MIAYCDHVENFVSLDNNNLSKRQLHLEIFGFILTRVGSPSKGLASVVGREQRLGDCLTSALVSVTLRPLPQEVSLYQRH